MDSLTEKQENLTKAIKTISKKDIKDRKGSKDLQALDECWNEFHRNHLQLTMIGDARAPYFTNRTHERTLELYQTLRHNIINEPSWKPNVRNYGDPELAEVRRQQSINFKAFKNTIEKTNINMINEKWELEDSLQKINTRWAAIDKLHWEIDSRSNDEEYDTEYEKNEAIYENIKKLINKKIWVVTDGPHSTVEVPIFNGDHCEWSNFKISFTKAIKKANISKKERMQVLRNKLGGEADRLINEYQVGSQNYDVAFKVLKDKFENDHCLLNSYMNNLINLPVSPKADMEHIKNVYVTTARNMNEITKLVNNMKFWEPLVVSIVSQKLDGDTYEEYLQYLQTPKQLPKLDEFLDFLECKMNLNVEPGGSKIAGDRSKKLNMWQTCLVKLGFRILSKVIQNGLSNSNN